jgi:VWFA-related protein
VLPSDLPMPAAPRHFGVLLVLVMLALPLAAQDPPPASEPQIFRTSVDFVRVDAYPRRDGRIVEGLTAADFQLKEDGKPQSIQTFEFVRHEPGPDRQDPRNRAEADRWVSDPRRRVFVIFFDLYHTTRGSALTLREQALSVLADAIGPTDMVAVMTAETPLSSLAFTQTLSTLSTELAGYWAGGLLDDPMLMPRNPAEAMLAACGGAGGPGAYLKLFRDIVTFTSLESLVAVVGSLRQERTHVIFLSEGWANRRGGIGTGTIRSLPNNPIPIVRDVQFGQFGQSAPDVAAARVPTCQEQILRLMAFDPESRFRALIRLANAANVSFHTVDVGGLRTQTGFPPNVSMLLELADNTDGITMVNSNDISRGIARVIDRTSSYYLLGYYSTNSATDGKYRKIDVDVIPRGIDVTARRGYTAVSPRQQQLADARSASAAVPSTVATALGPLAKWQAATDDDVMGAGRAGSSSLEVVVELSRRQFESGRWQGGADVDLDLVDETGRSSRAAAAIPPGGRSVVLQVPMAEAGRGPWRASLRARGAGGELAARIEVAAASTSPIGLARLFRRPSAGRASFVPTTAPFFMRTERLRAEWPLSGAGPTTVRLLDRRGQALAPGSAMSATSEQGFATVELYIAALSEADYLLEVTGPNDARELTPFRVVR